MKNDDEKLNKLRDKYLGLIESKLSVFCSKANVDYYGSTLSIWLYDSYNLKNKYIRFSKVNSNSQIEIDHCSKDLTGDELAFIWSIIRKDVASYYFECVDPLLKQKETYDLEVLNSKKKINKRNVR